MTKKRFRFEQDHEFEEIHPSRRGQRRIGEFWDAQGRHNHGDHHYNPFYDQAMLEVPFSPAALSPRGPPSIQEPGRIRGIEASPVFEWQRPLPSTCSRGQSYLDTEAFERNSAQEDHGYQDNSFADNRHKRSLSRGYTQKRVHSPVQKNPRVLSKMQRGKSVWERIEERPSLVSSSFSPQPLLSLSELSSPEEYHELDISYKSNSLVAKVLIPSSPSSVAPISSEKGPTLKAAPRKKLIKKVAKKRSKVVVPIVTDAKLPGVREGTPKSPLPNNPHQTLGDVKASPNLIVSSSKDTTDVGSFQSSPKRIGKTTVFGKRPAKKLAKNLGSREGSVAKCTKRKGKAKIAEKKAEKHLNVKTTEVTAMEHYTLQPCHQDFTVITSVREIAVEQFTRAENSVEGVNVSEMGKEECLIHYKKAGQNSAAPMVFDAGFINSASPQFFAQESMINMESPRNKATKKISESLVLVDNEFAEDTIKQASPTKEGKVNPTNSDIESSKPSVEGYSGSELGNDAQVLLWAGSSTSCSSGNSLQGKSIKRKREGEEEKEQLEVVLLNKYKLGGGKSDLGDPYLRSNVNYRLSTLPTEVRDIDLNRTLPDGILYDGDHDNCLSVQNCPLESDCTSAGQDVFNIPVGDSMGERMEQLLTSRQSNLDSLVVASKAQDIDHLIDAEQSYSQLGGKEFNGDHCNDNREEKPLDKDDPSISSETLSDYKGEEIVPSDKAMTLHCPTPGRAQPSSLDQPKSQVAANLKIVGEESTSQKTNLASGIPRAVTNQVRLSGSTKGPGCSSHSARHKTWHRSDASLTLASHGKHERPGASSMHKQSPKKLTRPQSSYIRKGNSLIRKSATEVHPPTQTHNLVASSSAHTTRRSTCTEITVDRTDCVTHSNLPVERPKTPPLPLVAKLPNCIIIPQRDFTYPMSEVPTSEADKETQVRQLEGQTVDLPSGSLDHHSIAICRKSETDKTKRMVYVKHKSNQLVAAPRPESSDSPSGTSQSLSSLMSSDLYYRLKKNQLVRNGSSDFQQKLDKLIAVDKSTSDEQRTSMVSSLKRSTTSLFKKRLGKVIQKSYKHPKSSLVWTLSGEKPHEKGVKSLDHWKVLPHLFPWKRTIYRKNSALVSGKYPLPLISRKLQLTRKRNTTYKLSNDGFTLRKAGVFSIGGSSLKWSKSIERHSKKASEDATRAVAEAERKRRERKKNTFVGAKGKTRNFLPRERIFRVGSARYKMDSSRRTLIRIPDEQSSSGRDQQSGNKSQKSFVPRRLLIGNDEYIRIGNGNQLVRDPRKRIRNLASEKVRWSLHTARLRLLRKQQYCQFFTRFGKCNKSGGKCAYIHDTTKVAICTKYLRGLCSDTNCKLTHKVLPERMPDCSYFLQGLCTNLNCPYRHVNVNPRASVCDGFLRGYCANGDECHKKHSYVCPVYEAMGKCQQGSKCKFHHPKRRNKSKKRKQPIIQSNSSGRYFGSNVMEDVEPLIVYSDRHDVEEAAEHFYHDGRFADFISLDAGIEGGGIETNTQMDSQSSPRDSGPSDMQADDLDVLIKPVRIMKNVNSTNAFAN